MFSYSELLDNLKSTFFLAGVSIAFLVWTLDHFVHAVFLHQGTFYQLLLHQKPYDIYMRSFISAIIIILSFISSVLLNRSRQMEDKFRGVNTRLTTIIESEPECVKTISKDGTLLSMNPAGLALVEAESFDEVDGVTIYDLITPEHRDKYIELNKRVFEGESAVLEYEIIGLKGGRKWLDTHATPLFDNSGSIISHLAVTRDITERKQIEALKTGQQYILELMSLGNSSVAEIFDAIIRFAENQFTNLRATILYVIDNKLQHCAAPSMSTDYIELINGLQIGPSVGSCGTAAYRKERVIVTDVASDPLWADYNQLGAKYGFCACWSEPVFDNSGKVLATFALYNKKPGVPSDYEIQLIEAMANLVSIAIERKQTEQALRVSEKKYRGLLENNPDGMVILNVKGEIEIVNQQLQTMTGYTIDDLTGQSVEVLIPERFKTHKQLRDSYLANPHVRMMGKELELFVRRKDGSEFPAEISLSPLETADGINISAAIRDISERRKAEEELRKLSRAMEASSSIVIITDTDGNIEYVNPKFTEVTGYTREEAIGQNASILRTDTTSDSVYDEISKSIDSEGEWKGELRSRKKDGSLYWDRCSVSCVKDAKGEITHFISIQEDVTHEYELEEQLSYQGSHDALTGLLNRHEFERYTERLLSTIRQDEDEHALCFMDLDQFKVVNDTCGHTAGDELLRQLGQLLQAAVRQRDTLARLGGDEFGILIEHCSLDHAYRVATSLQKAVQDYQFSWEGHSFKVSVSIGLVAITEATPNLTELLKEADAACYTAKDLGRNRIHVYHIEDSELAQRHGEMQWVPRINQALEEDRLCLYAQPIVPLDSRTETHYELLIRMKDEKGKLIPPGAFLPAAERYNLIELLDTWVIEKAFSSLTTHPVFLEQINFISINLSGQSLTKPNFLNFIITQLDETGIKGRKICFEITETAAISNLSTAMKFISTMKGFGCRFALDDFGSGLSSFGYLKNLPVDYLKIDGMFVKDIVDDPIDRAMVKSINEIGQVMGMRTIAEFVENDEIKGMLREIGVNYAQGYGTGRPQPFDELLGQLSNVTDIKDPKDNRSES
jgi:diguanylate cyclase (GGDEF)-like protein/PAS domain S-box-containing protein